MVGLIALQDTLTCWQPALLSLFASAQDAESSLDHLKEFICIENSRAKSQMAMRLNEFLIT